MSAPLFSGRGKCPTPRFREGKMSEGAYVRGQMFYTRLDVTDVQAFCPPSLRCHAANIDGPKFKLAIKSGRCWQESVLSVAKCPRSTSILAIN